jgi:type II secretory pathway pseudopilin PulG
MTSEYYLRFKSGMQKQVEQPSFISAFKVRSIKIKRAFTIWELLCIIIVIFLLIGLLMPALSRVRKQSTRIVCGSNLRGYGMAMQIYLSDNDNKFPDKENEWFYAKESFSAEHPLGCRWHDMTMAPNGKIMTNNPQYKGLIWDYINPSGKKCLSSISICRKF